jgi:hypothetical protein
MSFLLLLVALTGTLAAVSAECHKDLGGELRFFEGLEKVEEFQSPAKSLLEMCEREETSRRHQKTLIQIEHFNREECLEAAEYVGKNEKETGPGDWTVASEFNCGRLRVKITELKECHKTLEEEIRFFGDKEAVEEIQSPAKSLLRMCEREESSRKHHRTLIETENFNQIDCLEAVEYVKKNEKETAPGEWSVPREFHCGAMRVKITELNE